MAIEHLLNLVSPPESPVGLGSAALWNELESQTGLCFPKDYMDYIDHYGSGGWCDELGIESPFFDSHALLQQHEQHREHYLRMQSASCLTRMPFPLFPEHNGLLLLGGDCDANSLYWYCCGPADVWPLILYDREFWHFEKFEMPLTDWLVLWLTGILRSELFIPVSMCAAGPIFRPSRIPRATTE
ncbi:MAG: hypothetical protein IAG10_15255 [Planctomycetaceae bacterium]|nr:hypothetical protein [Planctomycetaceae bacterium]